jgi:xanthine dehydrogenase accessory factor
MTKTELTGEAASETTVEILVVDIKGSVPSQPGARAFVGARGLIKGTVGGGKLEATAIEIARDWIQGITQQSVFSEKRTLFKTFNLQRDLGMSCGGEASLFFELKQVITWPIAVFGAGHIAQTLVPYLCELNANITCFDTRREWIDRMPEHPKLIKHTGEDPSLLIKRLHPETFFVVMTQGHATDLPIVEAILKNRVPPYLGVIGSHQKARTLRAKLAELGVNTGAIERVTCPIGFDWGDQTPIEITHSIIAQLLSVRDRLRTAQ